MKVFDYVPRPGRTEGTYGGNRQEEYTPTKASQKDEAQHWLRKMADEQGAKKVSAKVYWATFEPTVLTLSVDPSAVLGFTLTESTLDGEPVAPFTWAEHWTNLNDCAAHTAVRRIPAQALNDNSAWDGVQEALRHIGR